MPGQQKLGQQNAERGQYAANLIHRRIEGADASPLANPRRVVETCAAHTYVRPRVGIRE
jgi:hypothetical protein